MALAGKIDPKCSCLHIWLSRNFTRLLTKFEEYVNVLRYQMDGKSKQLTNNLKYLIKLKTRKDAAVVLKWYIFVDLFHNLKCLKIIFKLTVFSESIFTSPSSILRSHSVSVSQSRLHPREILALKKVNAFHVTHAQTMHRRIDKKGEPFLILMAYFQNWFWKENPILMWTLIVCTQ